MFKRVFERVFDFGGVLVVTSNSSPEELYLGGLNRSAFSLSSTPCAISVKLSV